MAESAPKVDKEAAATERDQKDELAKTTASEQQAIPVGESVAVEAGERKKGKGTWYAHTDLVWSNPSAGNDQRMHVLTGQTVDTAYMDDEVFDTFVGAGAIMEVPRVDNLTERDLGQELANRDARIAELEKALAEAQKK